MKENCKFLEENIEYKNLDNIRQRYDIIEVDGVKVTRNKKETDWMERYRPRKMFDLIIPSDTRKYLDNAIKKKTMKHTLLYSQRGGLGKEQPYSEPVLTPNGWTQMGDLKVNDSVIDKEGKPTKVVDIFEQGDKDVYEFEFLDKTTTRCGIDHLWEVVKITNNKDNRTLEVKDTKFLIDNLHIERFDKRYNKHYLESKYAISMLNNPVQFTKKEVKIDPYALGLLLGDGSFRSQAVTFSNVDTNIVNKLSELIPENVVLQSPNNDKSDYRLKGKKQETREHLKGYGLWGLKSVGKFIPKDYLYNDVETRQKLYQGLIDTDGHKMKGKAVEFSTSSKQLAYDFIELARSLGYFVTTSIKKSPSYTYKGEKRFGEDSYRIYINNKTTKTIKSIKKLDYKENSRCIKVDNKDSLYITSNYNVTHNTSISQVVSHEMQCDFLTLSANLERGIQAIKDKIVPFSSRKSMYGGKKLCLIEEIGDATSPQVDSLKSVIDKYSSNMNIIITTNTLGNISQPLRTRFKIIDFNKVSKEDEQQMTIDTIKRIKSILDIENVEYNPDDIKYLFSKYKFSFREILMAMDSSVIDGKLELKRLEDNKSSLNDILKIINTSDYKGISEISESVNVLEFLEELGTNYTTLLTELEKIPGLIMVLNELQNTLNRNPMLPSISFTKACFDMIKNRMQFNVQ